MMNLAEKLDGLRLKYPECKTLAFADVSTGMVLYASADESLKQEQLDSLCGTAVEMLSGSIAMRVGEAISEQSSTGIFQAIIIERDEVGIFLKSMSNPVDALCCVCTSDIALGAFIKEARDNLAGAGAET